MGKLKLAGMVLGLSLGGFFDGIVFHQLLQWHHMLSSVNDPAVAGNLRLNILADGLFHAGAWILAVLGVILLWRAGGEFPAPRAGRILAGGLLMGAGAFNLLEGLVNHHLLGLHHVRQESAHVMAWDLAFLAVGAFVLVIGWWVAGRGREVTQTRAG